MSPSVNLEGRTSTTTNNGSFQSSEESWFVDQHGRETKRPFRSSPSMPPPPIGDEVADSWFR